MNKLEKAIKALKLGIPVLVFDFPTREAEVDIFILAEKVTPEKVRLLRKDGGGLICIAVHPKLADILGLPFMHELLKSFSNMKPLVKSVPYDPSGRPSFSISINHVNTRTGITDIDRSLTISEFGKLCARFWKGEISAELFRLEFFKNFRAPGHVFLLRAAEKILSERRGHTELAVALALLANVTPCVALCEMLADDGRALPLEVAKKYAEKNGYVLISGDDIVKAWISKFQNHSS